MIDCRPYLYLRTLKTFIPRKINFAIGEGINNRFVLTSIEFLPDSKSYQKLQAIIWFVLNFTMRDITHLNLILLMELLSEYFIVDRLDHMKSLDGFYNYIIY